MPDFNCVHRNFIQAGGLAERAPPVSAAPDAVSRDLPSPQLGIKNFDWLSLIVLSQSNYCLFEFSNCSLNAQVIKPRHHSPGASLFLFL